MRNPNPSASRREFLQTAAIGMGGLLASPLLADKPRAKPLPKLAGEVGITTSSLSRQTAANAGAGKIALMDLPRVLREELDMRVIDLNTSTLGALDDKQLDQFRRTAEKAGCVLINLKMNQRGLNMNSAEPDVREKAIKTYKRSIDVAARLGCRWARPLPMAELPDMKLHVAVYQELADYAAERNVQMLVENFGWMESDPESVVKLVKAVGRNVAACPDTGNWKSNALRDAGLKATFPGAVTCDFKAKVMGPNGEHPAYDLKRCFEIGWEAGFHGPWCLEHAHQDRKTLFRELTFLRDQLRTWMNEKRTTDAKRS